ncbi:MAG TPA: hypothetical protein PK141_25390 [Polyangiaceae bacterium]|nr:hypothetical protein [Polyangiaceae bacterium]
MRRARRLAAALAALAVLGTGRTALAEPQLSAALTTGPAFRNLRVGPVKPAFHLGARFDAIFLRSAQRDMGVGPYVDVGTSGFDSLEAGGGLEWLVPAGSTSFILSGGAEARVAGGTVQPGATWGLFWGSRSYNYHSIYGFGAGLFAQGRYGLGDFRTFDLVTGVQVDAVVLALPFLLLVNAVR